MRIGIVTQPLWGNYGGILQNYALQQVLKNLGHEPITIDFMVRGPWSRYILSTIKTCLLWFIPGRRRKFGKFRADRKDWTIDTFVSQNIYTTKMVFSYRRNILRKYRIEALITGSDQVWRPLYNSNLKEMYLDFARKDDIRKIAYAASYGTSEHEYSEKDVEKCRKGAEKLTAVSVREHSGIKLFRDYFNSNAVKVLDPTLLLTKVDYQQLIGDLSFGSHPYIGMYVLDKELYDSDMLAQVKRLTGIGKERIITEKNDVISPKEWLAMIRDADFIITDSFHGTVFSIIFQRPFLSLCNLSRGADRFKSLLEPLGLEDRLFTGSYDNLKELLSEEIDWQEVNQKLQTQRTLSLNFLISSLG